MSRQGGMSGGEAIMCQEIEAWARQMRIRLTPWEFESLRLLDVICLSEARREGNTPVPEDDEPDPAKAAQKLMGFLRGQQKPRV